MANGAKGIGEAVKGEVTGQCLCGAVRYILCDGFRLHPYACHCTSCQSRTGSAFSEHMLFTLADLDIDGELDVGHFTQPSGVQSSISGCAVCKARIYATNDQREGMASLRCGTLDASTSLDLRHHIWVGSKQEWVVLPTNALTMDEQPRGAAEWVKFLGVVQ